MKLTSHLLTKSAFDSVDISEMKLAESLIKTTPDNILHYLIEVFTYLDCLIVGNQQVLHVIACSFKKERAI